MAGSIRWGILGTGFIAHEQTHDLIENGFSVTAVGSRTVESASAFAAEFGIANSFGSYQQLVESPDVDVIYVSSPHPFHHEHALLALRAGKHVLVEKAFTINERQASELADVAAEKNLVVLEAMWTRFLPHMVRIREIIAAGTLGAVRTLIADHTQLLSSDPLNRANNPELGGGALLDLGIYPISFAWDLFGEPSAVIARSSPTVTGVDRQTAVILEYPAGEQAVLQFALDTAGPNTAVILGTEGWIAIERVWYSATSFTVYDSSNRVIERYDDSVTPRGMQFQAWEVERLIEAGQISGTIMPLAQSVQIMGTLDEIRRQIGLVYPSE